MAEVGGRDVPVLGTIDDLDETVRRTGVTHLIVAFSSVADARISRLIQRCQELGVEVSVVPRMFDTINDRVGYDTVGGLPLLSFEAVDPDGLQFALKHALDRVLALTLLIVFSPVILLSALRRAPVEPGPRALQPAPRRARRQGLQLLQVPLDAPRAAGPRTAARRQATRSTSCSGATPRPAASRARIAARPSDASCAAPRSTSCRSCSTCCAAT